MPTMNTYKNMKKHILCLILITAAIFSCQGQVSTAKKYEIHKKEAEWRRQLSPEQYHITREKGTERAFTGAYWDHHEKGRYQCICCHALLFQSDTKYDSRTGWPSFWKPAVSGNIEQLEDYSLGMRRMEVNCSRCGAHLGHVFNDGPQPTGLRYCINSGALEFIKN